MKRNIGRMVRMFVNGLEDQSSIPGWVIPKTQKMLLDASLLKTQHYKVWIKGKWYNPGKGVAPSLHLGVVAIEKGAFGSPLITVSQLTITGPLALCIECSPIVWEIGVQSQVKSYQRLKKCYLMPPCLKLSIIRYGSRVKWNNPGKVYYQLKRESSDFPLLQSPILLTYS